MTPVLFYLYGLLGGMKNVKAKKELITPLIEYMRIYQSDLIDDCDFPWKNMDCYQEGLKFIENRLDNGIYTYREACFKSQFTGTTGTKPAVPFMENFSENIA